VCPRSPRLTRPTPARAALGIVAVALLLVSPPRRPVAAAEATAVDPNRVKAAFLRNFARYVVWPHDAFADARSPWRVGILGDDPFGDVLEQTLARSEQDRPFEIHRAQTLDELPRCHIVVVTLHRAGERRAALQALRGGPVLTVGEAPEFLREGGVIRLDVAERVYMSINLDQARASSLKIQTKMLEVSRELLEHGVVRRVR
jgi:hypothetical protein